MIIDWESITHNSLTLSWKPPKLSVGSSFRYKVEYKITDKKFQKLVELPDSNLTYEVLNLNANTEYYFRIAAINSAGCGPYKVAADSQFTSKFNFYSQDS